MSLPSNKKLKSPGSRDLNEIVDQYSTPVSSSSLRPHSVLSMSSPRSADTLPSSPPSYHTKPYRRHQSSTNSGYLDRAQLFGRSSSNPISDSTPTSQGMKRVEKRRLTGKPTPDHQRTSTALPRVTTTGNQAFSQRPSFNRCTNNRGESLTTPSVSSWRPSRHSSQMSLRSQLDTVTEDLWVDAGTPQQELVGSGYGPGPTLFRFSKSVIKRFEPQNSAANAQKGVETQLASSTELALRRLTGAASRSSSRHLHKSSWTSRLFKRREPTSSLASYTSSCFSKENISGLDSVELSSRISPSGDILSRKKADKGVSNNQITITHDDVKAISLSDTKGDYNSTTEVESKRPAFPLAKRLAHEASLEDFDRPSPLPTTNPQCKQSHKYRDDFHTNITAVLESETGISSSLVSAASLHPITPTTISPPPPAPSHNHSHPEHNRRLIHHRYTSLARAHTPSTTTRDQSPQPARNHLALSPTMTTHAIDPVVSQAHSTLGPAQNVVDHALCLVQASHGVSFASISAIMHGCITFATLRFVVCNGHRDLHLLDLAADMGVAVLVGQLVCVVLHVLSTRRF
jgi:hypothetical protein